MVERLLVNLTDAERELLLRAAGLPPRLHSIVASAQEGRRGWGITLSADDADEIRERCGDIIGSIGFDERDEPTKDGLLLESMIDKFFTG
jgi:hypothetical protein